MGNSDNRGRDPDDKDEETGEFSPEFTDQEFIQAVKNHDMAGTNDVAAAVGCAEKTAYKRLRQLVEEGKIVTKKIGKGRGTRIWLSPDNIDSQIINLVDEGDVVTAESISNKLEIDKNAAENKLSKLEYEGKVASKKIGDNTVWYISD